MYVVTLARKPPSEPTVADNVLKHGVGALDIDAARTPHTESVEFLSNRSGRKAGNAWADMGLNGKPHSYEANDLGRWPQNMILGGQTVVDDLDGQSEVTPSRFFRCLDTPRIS
jgi:site-specific DNA-methyltransferase (adenine-specific)